MHDRACVVERYGKHGLLCLGGGNMMVGVRIALSYTCTDVHAVVSWLMKRHEPGRFSYSIIFFNCHSLIIHFFYPNFVFLLLYCSFVCFFCFLFFFIQWSFLLSLSLHSSVFSCRGRCEACPKNCQQSWCCYSCSVVVWVYYGCQTSIRTQLHLEFGGRSSEVKACVTQHGRGAASQNDLDKLEHQPLPLVSIYGNVTIGAHV